jgi:hypothetical protein
MPSRSVSDRPSRQDLLRAHVGWCAGTPLDALARRSFALHAALPNELAGDWGYRRMAPMAVSLSPMVTLVVSAELDWLAAGVVIASRLGTAETTAITPAGSPLQ